MFRMSQSKHSGSVQGKQRYLLIPTAPGDYGWFTHKTENGSHHCHSKLTRENSIQKEAGTADWGGVNLRVCNLLELAYHLERSMRWGYSAY